MRFFVYTIPRIIRQMKKRFRARFFLFLFIQYLSFWSNVKGFYSSDTHYNKKESKTFHPNRLVIEKKHAFNIIKKHFYHSHWRVFPLHTFWTLFMALLIPFLLRFSTFIWWSRRNMVTAAQNWKAQQKSKMKKYENWRLINLFSKEFFFPILLVKICSSKRKLKSEETFFRWQCNNVRHCKMSYFIWFMCMKGWIK